MREGSEDSKETEQPAVPQDKTQQRFDDYINYLKRTPTITKVDVHYTMLGGPKKLPRLRQLVDTINANPNLQFVDMDGCSIEDDGCKLLATLKIRELLFRDNLPFKEGLLSLVESEIEELDLSGCGVDDEIGRIIAKVAKQKKLKIERAPDLTKEVRTLIEARIAENNSVLSVKSQLAQHIGKNGGPLNNQSEASPPKDINICEIPACS